jgi:site-specific recombinase XerD
LGVIKLSKYNLNCPACAGRATIEVTHSELLSCRKCELHITIPDLYEFMDNHTGQYCKQIANKLIYFTNWLNKNKNKSEILSAKYSDVVEFLRTDIDQRGNFSGSAEKWRITLNVYYVFIAEEFRSRDKNLINPVPSRQRFKFHDNQEKKDFESKYLTWPTINRILKFCFYTYWLPGDELYKFLAILILAYTGMRISEVVTIKLEDINFTERKIISGRVVGKSKRGVCLYFVPGFIIDYIKEYINSDCYKMISNNLFLFPNLVKNANADNLSTKTIAYCLREIVKPTLKLSEPCNPHAFRDAINSERKIKFKTPEEDRDYLLNQKPKNVNSKNYLKRFKNWKNIQILSDNNMPYPVFIP